MAAAAVRNVFVYGSLLAPEVLNALLRRVPRASLAVVHDYHRYSIKDRIYPAVSPKKGDIVFGKVLFDLSDQELHILDEFEDVEYTKSTVSPLILVLPENLSMYSEICKRLKMRHTQLEQYVITTALQQKAHDINGESVNSAATKSEAQEMTGPGCLERVSNVLNGQTEDVAPEGKPVEISPGRFVGLNLVTEVTAYIYVWVNESDPNLEGNWDYEEWAKTYLEDYVKMCEEFESELSKDY